MPCAVIRFANEPSLKQATFVIYNKIILLSKPDQKCSLSFSLLTIAPETIYSQKAERFIFSKTFYLAGTLSITLLCDCECVQTLVCFSNNSFQNTEGDTVIRVWLVSEETSVRMKSLCGGLNPYARFICTCRGRGWAVFYTCTNRKHAVTVIKRQNKNAFSITLERWIAIR